MAKIIITKETVGVAVQAAGTIPELITLLAEAEYGLIKQISNTLEIPESEANKIFENAKEYRVGKSEVHDLSELLNPGGKWNG